MINISRANSKNRKGERGNVLFYILIAIALLAALSYAVAQSSRGGTSHLDDERAKLAASEILEYTNIISSAVMQLKLRGCKEGELNFANTITATVYTNGAAPSDNTCDIFHLSGGGVQYKEPQTVWIDKAVANSEDQYGEILFTAKTCIDQIGTGTTNCNTGGTSVGELIMAVPYLKKEICIELNNKLGVGTKDADPPQDIASAWASTPEFNGSFFGGTRIQDSAKILDGRSSACFQSTTYPASGYHFYKVLLAR